MKDDTIQEGGRLLLSYIYYNAVHEAAHVLFAYILGFDIESVFINSEGFATTRVSYDPAKMMPTAVYCQKIAGAIAVEIQNEHEHRSDDNGFGDETNPDHDAYTARKVVEYLKAIAPNFDASEFEASHRESVKKTLASRWTAVETVAAKIAIAITSAQSLSSEQIYDLLGAKKG
jgi:hypothetical protein